MYKNYLKIAIRNIIRQKGYSFINIFGLTLGMASCILIMLWVFDELSYDKFHENSENLYRVELDTGSEGTIFHIYVTPYPLAPVLKTDFPEIIDASRFIELSRIIVKHEETGFYESGVVGVDPSFFSMFSFPFVKGDSETALSDPYSIVMTESMAEKYFEGEEPVGKIINLENAHDLTVTGIIRDVPENSSVKFDILIPYEFLKRTGRGYEADWDGNEIITFVQLVDNTEQEDINPKIAGLIKSHIKTSAEVMLFPLTDLRLYEKFGYGTTTGNIQYVYIFSVIAVFVLLIACINFMNLSTARSAKRAKEVGMRKVVGAHKKNLITQFYGESVLMAVTALILSLIISILVLPVFNSLADKNLSIDLFRNYPILLGILLIAVLTGLISGSYPALYLSSFRPIQALKGNEKKGSGRSKLRNILVIIQYALSAALIIGTVVVYNQLVFMHNKSLGWDKEQVVYISMDSEIRNSYSLIKRELLKDPVVMSVTGTYQRPFYMSANARGADWDGRDSEYYPRIGINYVDYDFVETLNIEMLEGRSFSEEFTSDATSAYLVNEEMAKLMEKESVVDQRFDFAVDGKIVGVMKNFHHQPVKRTIAPLVLLISHDRINYILIKLRSGDINASISSLKETWSKVMPDYPLDYRFLDEDFENLFNTENRMVKLLTYFSVFAILIASLGLFGLASYSTEQRSKEIGIRKTLGASEGNLVTLLVKDFLKLVFLSNIIALPFAMYFMKNWLENFAYSEGLGISTFALTGVLTIVIALITVGYKSISAAFSNPVNSLKYE
ncbi:MAG: FtsX-like permease family protein [bacterium]|nr:FtsX-like permease family protein [bacterium]